MDPILIVDDEKDNLEALRRLLRSQYDITAVTSPIDALKQVMTKKFHVIISDQRMSDMTGVELLEKIKGVQPDAIRILLTGYTDVDSVIGAINRGQIYRYIAKPWDPEDLRMTLRQANEAYRLRKELEEKNTELNAALKELQTLDSAKARFLSLVSHELNTPITVLSSFVPLLKEKGEQGKAISAIESASGRLGEVVRDVIEFVKFESSPTLQLEMVALSALVNESTARIAKTATEKGIAIENGVNSIHNIKVDRGRMGLALGKLFEDFVDRAPQKSTIKIDGILRDEKTVLRIQRAGEVLSDHAFEPLEFGGDPLKHKKSVGLGLAMCRTIIEAHGGSIASVKSNDFPACVEIAFA